MAALALTACSWDVSVGPQGRYELAGSEGIGCVSGPRVLDDAGPDFVVDHIMPEPDESRRTHRVTALVRRRDGAAAEIRDIEFRFGGELQGVTTLVHLSDARPFLGVGRSDYGSLFFLQAESADPSSALNHLSRVETRFDADLKVSRFLTSRSPSQSKMLGFVDEGDRRYPLALQTNAPGGARVDALDVEALDFANAPLKPIVEGGVVAAFPWSGASRYVNYAETAPEGVVLRSRNVQDPNDTTSVPLPDATRDFFPVAATRRVLYFQYLPKSPTPSAVPQVLPLLRVDLGANDLGPSAPARTPRVVTPAMAVMRNAELPVLLLDDTLIVAPIGDGKFALVSADPASKQLDAPVPLPELTGATDLSHDSCNLYWVTGSVVMAMPLPTGGK